MSVESKYFNSDFKNDEQIISKNLPLVHSLIKRYKNRGVDYDDLFQIGSIGLLNAVRRFNPALGYSFSTYASSLIIGEIKRFLRDDGMIKISRHLKETATKINICINEFTFKHSREPTISELVEISGVSTEDITAAFEATRDISSIDNEIFDGIAIADALTSNSDETEKTINAITIQNCINAFPPRERNIITLRYFKDKTQKETALLLGISQVQVSRIEKKLLYQIKQSFSS